MDKLQEFIYQKIGEASMCWDKIPSGVFETTRASIIAKDIITKVEEEKKKAQIEILEKILKTGLYNDYVGAYIPEEEALKELNELKNGGSIASDECDCSSRG